MSFEFNRLLEDVYNVFKNLVYNKNIEKSGNGDLIISKAEYEDPKHEKIMSFKGKWYSLFPFQKLIFDIYEVTYFSIEKSKWFLFSPEYKISAKKAYFFIKEYERIRELENKFYDNRKKIVDEILESLEKKLANRKITIKTFEARKSYILSWGLDAYLNKYVSVKLSSPEYETHLFFIDFFKKLNI